MNKFYCYVEVNGERQYFSDHSSDLQRANEVAQVEANRTGKPVKRQNSKDIGHSLFYPKAVK